MRKKATITFLFVLAFVFMCMGVLQSQPFYRWRPYSAWSGSGPVLHLPFYAYGSNAQKIWDVSGNNRHGTITGAVPWPGKFTVAQTSMKISAVALTAFVDFGFVPPQGRQIQIFDSAGKAIWGITGPGGTAETLSATEHVANGDFTLGDTGWTKDAGWTIVDQGGGDFEAVATAAANASFWQGDTNASGALFYCTVNCTNYVAGTWSMRLGNIYNPPVGSFYASGGIKGVYICNTGTNGGIFLRSSTALTARFDDYSVKQVLTPSATGCLIYSDSTMATQSWAGQDSGFNYNDASGYTVYIGGDALQGWYFDGVNDVVTITDFLETGNSAKELTVMVWQKYLGTAATKFFFTHYDTGANQRAWSLDYQASGLFRVYLSTDGTAATKNYTSSIVGWNNTRWMLTGFTFNNGTLTLYANGIADTNPTKTSDGAMTTIHNSTANITVGTSLNSGVWNGGSQCAIGEPLIFNRALSAVEWRSYYDNTQHIFN